MLVISGLIGICAFAESFRNWLAFDDSELHGCIFSFGLMGINGISLNIIPDFSPGFKRALEKGKDGNPLIFPGTLLKNALFVL